MGWTAPPLDPAPDSALTGRFAGCLPGGRFGGPLLAFTAVESTQAVCRRLAEAGAPEGTVVLADYQGAGRGQRGRVWTAPPGSSVLVSCLLRPPLPAGRWPELSTVAAAAVVEAVEAAAGVRARVKSPNDVLVADKKLAGVLAEGVVGPGPFVILGIGINVAQRREEWPHDLVGRAVSLAELAAEVRREALLAAVLGRLAARYDTFLN
ncbi:MAG TPA: biotin--[acetyl-CoA-carboxylase] ligase [Methylomirabilota bacterium]|jgi:BirA family biotin operon repressor/biotin-[acetyl-CoA-carboxylase] ligase|nr:biotin--[acetyl-CoA-carboxylase] ligase [Methylomirabilota bacterium]